MSGIKVMKLDELAAMDEDELRARMRNVRRSLRRNRDRNERQLLEVESCYLHREIEVREQRRAAHTKWLSDKKERKNKEVA